MRYHFALPVPPGTTQESPATLDCVMMRGTLREIELYFPPGQAGLVRVQIWRGEHQLYPTNPGEYWLGDDTHITANEQYKLDEKPTTLTLVAWSPSATLAHTVYVDFTLDQTGQGSETMIDAELPG